MLDSTHINTGLTASDLRSIPVATLEANKELVRKLVATWTPGEISDLVTIGTADQKRFFIQLLVGKI